VTSWRPSTTAGAAEEEGEVSLGWIVRGGLWRLAPAVRAREEAPGRTTTCLSLGDTWLEAVTGARLLRETGTEVTGLRPLNSWQLDTGL
jgi:hypothetical protein